VIDATDAKGGATSTAISGDGWTGVRVQGTRDAVVVWPNAPNGELAYRAPRAKAVTHVVLDAPARDGKATVAAKPDGDACAVTVAAGGTLSARPVIVTLDEACAVTSDPEEPSAVSSEGHPAPMRLKSRVRRGGGCCRAETTPGSPIAMTLVVLAVLWRRRQRPASRPPR
jgi:MYXO-CTERM domain-containing protein